MTPACAKCLCVSVALSCSGTDVYCKLRDLVLCIFVVLGFDCFVSSGVGLLHTTPNSCRVAHCLPANPTLLVGSFEPYKPVPNMIYTVFQKSDAKIQITITMAHLIRINYPLSSFNYRLSRTNVANFNKIRHTVSEQQLFKKWNSKTEISNMENTN